MNEGTLRRVRAVVGWRRGIKRLAVEIFPVREAIR